MFIALGHSRAASCTTSVILEGLPLQHLNGCYNYFPYEYTDGTHGRWESTSANIGCRLAGYVKMQPTRLFLGFQVSSYKGNGECHPLVCFEKRVLQFALQNL